MPYLGEIAGLGTALCWSFGALAFQSASRRVGSLQVNLIRLCMAFVGFVLWGLVVWGRPLPTDASGHAWLWLSVSGLIGFTFGDLCLFQAFVLIGARLSMLVMALVPPITALSGWVLLGETLTPLQWVGMTVTMAGVGWVVLERQPASDGQRVAVPLRGLLLALGGAVGQAVGLALSKYGMRDYDPFAATQIRVIAGIAGFGVLFAVLGRWRSVLAALGDGRAMAAAAAGAGFGPFLGVSLSLLAVQHTRAGVAATLMALVPVTIIPTAMLIMKERVSLRAFAGALVAVCGAALMFV